MDIFTRSTTGQVTITVFIETWPCLREDRAHLDEWRRRKPLAESAYFYWFISVSITKCTNDVVVFVPEP